MSVFFSKFMHQLIFIQKWSFQASYHSQFAENNSLYIRKIYHTFLTLCRFSRLSHPLVSQQSHFKRSEVLVGNLWVFMLDRVQRILS